MPHACCQDLEQTREVLRSQEHARALHPSSGSVIPRCQFAVEQLGLLFDLSYSRDGWFCLLSSRVSVTQSGLGLTVILPQPPECLCLPVTCACPQLASCFHRRPGDKTQRCHRRDLCITKHDRKVARVPQNRAPVPPGCSLALCQRQPGQSMNG